MSNPFGICMWAMDDVRLDSTLAKGLQPLIQDVYHLLITERGTMWTDPEFGFGLSDAVLSAFGPDELPSVADEIESSLAEDDRIASATILFSQIDDEVAINGTIIANTTPPTGFTLVGPLSSLKAQVLVDTQRLLNG